MVNAGTVNGSGFIFSMPEKARFFAISPGNVHFKKSVKYNVKAAFNHKRTKTAAPHGANGLEIAELKHELSALKAPVRRFVLTSLLQTGASDCGPEA
jgi:hypothetical protein